MYSSYKLTMNFKVFIINLFLLAFYDYYYYSWLPLATNHFCEIAWITPLTYIEFQRLLAENNSSECGISIATRFSPSFDSVPIKVLAKFYCFESFSCTRRVRYTRNSVWFVSKRLQITTGTTWMLRLTVVTAVTTFPFRIGNKCNSGYDHKFTAIEWGKLGDN